MRDVERIISEFRNEADIDFISLPHIASAVEHDLGLRSAEQIRRYALEVVRGLMARRVYPGDYDYATKISFWPGEPDDLLKRIEAEWIALGKTPNLEHSICWFAFRPSEAAQRTDARLTARQEIDLRPQLRRLDRLILRSAGVDPAALTFAFRPVWQMDAPCWGTCPRVQCT